MFRHPAPERKPFQPFRVYMNDGHVFEIPAPGVALAARSTFVVGVLTPDSPQPRVHHTLHFGWDEVARVELVSPVGSAS